MAAPGATPARRRGAVPGRLLLGLLATVAWLLPLAPAHAAPGGPPTRVGAEPGAGAAGGLTLPQRPEGWTLGTGRYVVVLDEPPAASYRGGVDGLARTAGRNGQGLRGDSPAVAAYAEHLRARQDRLAEVVGATPYYHYAVVLNGFAAQLSARQARLLDRARSVLAVVPDRLRATDNLPGHPTSPTARPGSSTGRTRGPHAGRDVVIGVVDTGVDSDNPSFAAGRRPAPARWRGGCDVGVDDDSGSRFDCGRKLVAGRYYLAGQGGPEAVWSGEFLSPEDVDGHGTMVASIAAGRAGVRAAPDGVEAGSVSGVAPGARLAAYKACWSDQTGQASCATSDVLAAVDQAVGDGVDVLVAAFAGSLDDVTDPVEVAFLHAADAGVVVAASAGNDGPRRSSVAHPGPWVTTVTAATTRVLRSTVVLGDGRRLVGASSARLGVPRSPLVLAAQSGEADEPVGEARRCLPGSLRPDAVGGAVVLCDRGVNARVEKSAVVEDAGGVGMLLVNPTRDDLVADTHAVPTLHLPARVRDSLYAYAGTNGATARLVPDAAGGAPSSSSLASPQAGRGPSAADPDLLKPDLAAPGTDQLAATAPEGHHGHRQDLGSGTSFAAAHVAGVAALVVRAHPDWSAAQVRSALMTGARDLDDTDDPFVQGAGLVAPRRALDPGLVLDSGYRQWSGYLAGRGLRQIGAADPLRGSALNQASVAVGELTGRVVVTRRVTNVGPVTATYTPSFDGLAGVKVGFSPASLTLAPGESGRVQLTFARVSAPLGRWAGGHVSLADGAGHRVRLPVAVRPVGVSAPDEVRLDGDTPLRLRSGVSGVLRAGLRGLVPGQDTTGTGQDTGGADFEPGLLGTWSQTLTVEGRRDLVRVETLPDTRADDLDLYLLDDEGQVVAASATESGAERVTVDGLPEGTYTIWVQPWFVADPAGSTTFTVRTFVVPPTADGTFAGDPAAQPVTRGRRVDLTLTAGERAGPGPMLGWVGWYEVGRPGRLLARTVVSTG